jgi:cytochrome c oxidase subunit III
MSVQVPTLPFARRPEPIISNGTLGTMLLLGSESVLFACFISAYMVLRMSAPMWPPGGTPLLTTTLSAWNTGVLVLSGFTVFVAGRASGRNRNALARSFLWTTCALGALFVGLQVVEFNQLYGRGLTLKTGVYGGILFTLVGCHALHILGGLIFLGAALQQPKRTFFAELYWYFVTAVWGLLFSILYIV